VLVTLNSCKKEIAPVEEIPNASIVNGPETEERRVFFIKNNAGENVVKIEAILFNLLASGRNSGVFSVRTATPVYNAYLRADYIKLTNMEITTKTSNGLVKKYSALEKAGGPTDIMTATTTSPIPKSETFVSGKLTFLVKYNGMSLTKTVNFTNWNLIVE
jgi:hypothetical protein